MYNLSPVFAEHPQTHTPYTTRYTPCTTHHTPHTAHHTPRTTHHTPHTTHHTPYTSLCFVFHSRQFTSTRPVSPVLHAEWSSLASGWFLTLFLVALNHAKQVGDIDDTGFCNFGAGGKKAWDHTCGVGTHVYASPEQLSGRKITDRADMFSVGILIVELFHVFSTGMERVVTLSNARKGGLPPQFFVDHPRVASLALNCLSHDQLLRPTPSALLRALEGPTSATTITHIPSPAISHVPSPSISPQSGKLEEAWSIASTPHATAAASPVTSAMCTHWSKPGCEDDFTLGDRMQPTEEAVSAPGQQQGQGQGLASEASVQGSARAVNRSLDLANASANAASMARLEELEAQISELLRERAEKDKEIEELNRKVQWQAGLASALLCTPVEHMWGKNWKQWKKKVVGLSAPDHTG